ncbi:MAG: response regulator transcription factor [Spirochaetales bacterium]|nr:response regulator transcription factor [Spirochaetales bacterium]
MAIGITLFFKDNKTESELLPYLGAEGYRVQALLVDEGATALHEAIEGDCLLFELGEGDFSLLTSLKELIEKQKKPLIVLSRNISALVRAELYRMGVQDVIPLPWTSQALGLRIRKALSRSGFKERNRSELFWQFKEDRLKLDFDGHLVYLNDKELSLTNSQWTILVALIDNDGLPLSRSFLLRQCLQFEQGNTRTLDNHIKNIRKQLGNRSYIETMRGYGYKLSGKALDKRAP